MHLELNENERKHYLGYDFKFFLKNLHYLVGSKGGKKETKDLLTEPRVAPGCTNRASSLTTFAHQAAADLAWWQAAYVCLFALKVCLFACREQQRSRDLQSRTGCWSRKPILVPRSAKAKLRRRRMIFLSFCNEFTYKSSIVQKRVLLLHKKELA